MGKIDCLALCEKMRDCSDLTERACLHIIQIGENEVNELYLKSKMAEAYKWNVDVSIDRFPSGTKIDYIKQWIRQLNMSPSCDGIIIQYPADIEDGEYLKEIISPVKDVDGLSNCSAHAPCTPKGIYMVLNEIGFKNKTIAVIGRGDMVGKHLIKWLQKESCTLILMNSSTSREQMQGLLLESDIIITAVGHPGLFDYKAINLHGVRYVIDAGISRVDGKQIGDFSHKNLDALYAPKVMYTPYVNGVGKLTVASLMENVYAKKQL